MRGFACSITYTCVISLILTYMALLIGCTGGNYQPQPATPDNLVDGVPQQAEQSVSWPVTLPRDAVQPWENLDSQGHVIPLPRKNPSAINLASEFLAGVERHGEGGIVTGNGEASALSSSAGSLSYAMYRIPLGGDEPGVVSVDCNVTAGGGYYVGLADYDGNKWVWHGPFTENHVRLGTAGRADAPDYTSSFGNVFVCVVANDGAGCDVVGIGVNPVDPADSEAPPAPEAPTIMPVNSGLLLEWLPVVAGDLAGYRIYHNSQWFFDAQGSGVKEVDSLEGLTAHLLATVNDETYIRLSAVDFSGNESAMSAVAVADPLNGAANPITVSVSAPSGGLGESITLTASGADEYDFDTDGDGRFDVTGNVSGVASIDTTILGVIRPRVHGSSSGGTSFACGGVSVIIAGNSRPVASAIADPQSGDAPLQVSFTGYGDDIEDDASELSYAWDLDGDGTYEPDTNLLVLGNEYSIPGIFGVKFRVTDTEGAWSVDTVPVMAKEPAGNMPPVAVLRGSQFTGMDTIDIEFSAADSYDTDGTIVDYEWDFDGNGSFNEEGKENDSRGTALPGLRTYTAGPPVVVSLRVTDNLAATHTAEFTVVVHGWVATLVDTEGDVGQYTSLAIVSGNPAISYYDVTNGDLKYVRASDAYGLAWGTPVIIDSGNQVGVSSCLVVVNGNPAISYFDSSNSDLMFARATDATGDSWEEPLSLDTAGDVGNYSSLAIVDGRPAVSYFDDTDDDLKYIRAADANGSAWGGPIAVVSTGNVGRFTSLLVVDGNPAISYYTESADGLRFVRANDASGSSWNSPQSIDSVGVGAYNSMAIIDGNPAISYWDGIQGDLMYARAIFSSGSVWGAPRTADSGGFVGSYTSLVYFNGGPAISYYDISNEDLLFITTDDVAGFSWNSPVTVDSLGNVGQYSSMALVDTMPAISYYRASGFGDLKYARLF